MYWSSVNGETRENWNRIWTKDLRYRDLKQAELEKIRTLEKITGQEKRQKNKKNTIQTACLWIYSIIPQIKTLSLVLLLCGLLPWTLEVAVRAGLSSYLWFKHWRGRGRMVPRTCLQPGQPDQRLFLQNLIRWTMILKPNIELWPPHSHTNIYIHSKMCTHITVTVQVVKWYF